MVNYKYIYGLVFLLIFIGQAHAAPVADLYQAEVAVDSRSAEARTQGLREGLQQVLIKVSGHPDVLTNSRIQNSLRQADQWVTRYTYEDKSVATLADEDNLNQLFLVITFDETAVNRLLSEADLPIWGSDRLTTLVWVAIERPDGTRQIVQAGGDLPVALEDNVAVSLTAKAKQRGVPLVFPLLDIQDARTINVSDIWGLFANPVRQASQRYRSDANLVGRLYQNRTGRWQGSWLLLIGNQTVRWHDEAVSLDEVLYLAIDHMSNALADQFAVVASARARESYTLQVRDIGNAEDYQRVIGYLNNINGVSDVEVITVAANELTLDLHFNGSLQGLEQAFSRDQVLLAEPSIRSPVISPMLVYRFRP